MRHMTAGRALTALLVPAGGLAVATGLRLGTGATAMPGNGAWPVVVGFALAGSGRAVLLEPRPPGPGPRAWAGVFRVAGAVLVMAVLFRLAGFLIAALAETALASTAFPSKGRRWAVPAAAVAASGLWTVPAAGLELPLRLWPLAGAG